MERQCREFESLARFEPRAIGLPGRGEPEQIRIAEASSGFLELFGVQPIVGRDFRPEDDQRQDGDVVLLSYGLWRRRFAGDEKIAGRVIILGQKPRTVVGVLPAGFSFPGKIDALAPRNIPPEHRRGRQFWMYMTLGRLGPGGAVASAQ